MKFKIKVRDYATGMKLDDDMKKGHIHMGHKIEVDFLANEWDFVKARIEEIINAFKDDSK